MDERQLIQLAQQGDSSAFEQVLAKYEKTVYHQAFRLLSNPEDAADVTQEVFFKVWKNLPSFRFESSFSTWLYRLTDNAAYDLLRREKKHRGESSLDDDENSILIPAPPSAQPQHILEQDEMRRLVEEGLSNLSDQHRRILVLREINGLSYEEIGEILDLAPGTVRSRIARARISLANFLHKKGNFFEL